MATPVPLDEDITSLPSHSSTFGGSKICHDALLLSQATSAATIAARSILEAGGSQETALKTGKAAAKSILKSEGDGNGSVSSSSIKSGSSFFKNKMNSSKIKRQADVVASMALIHAKNSISSNVNDELTIEPGVFSEDKKEHGALSPISEASTTIKQNGSVPAPAVEQRSAATEKSSTEKDLDEKLNEILSIPEESVANSASLSKFRTWQHPTSPRSLASSIDTISKIQAAPTGMVVSTINNPQPPPVPEDPKPLMHNDKDITSVDIQAEDPIYWGGHRGHPKPTHTMSASTDDVSDQLQANTSNYTSDYCTGASGSEEDESGDDGMEDSHVSGIYDDRSEPSETSANTEDSNAIRIRELRNDVLDDDEGDAFGSTFLNLFSCFDGSARDNRAIEMDSTDVAVVNRKKNKAPTVESLSQEEEMVKDDSEIQTIVLKAYNSDLTRDRDRADQNNDTEEQAKTSSNKIKETKDDIQETKEKSPKKKGFLSRVRSGSRVRSKNKGFRKSTAGKQQSRSEKETNREGSANEREDETFDPPSKRKQAVSTATSAATTFVDTAKPDEKQAAISKSGSKSPRKLRKNKKKGGNTGETAYEYYRPYD